jgi:uncharacterized protein (TIGR02147 family)
MNAKNKKANSGIFIGDFLNKVLAQKRKVNRRYSVRSLARTLNISDSSLGQLMKNQRRAGRNTLERISKKLGIEVEGIEQIVPQQLGAIEREITAELHDIYVNPLNLSILEATRIDGFLPEAEWVAKFLKIDLEKATQALHDLKAAQFLVLRNGQWIDAIGRSTVILKPAMTSELLRQAQIQLLEMSKIAVKKIEPELRDHTSITIAMNSELIPEVRSRIQEFRRDLAELIERKSEQLASRDSIYTLQLSFFPNSEVKGPHS